MVIGIPNSMLKGIKIVFGVIFVLAGMFSFVMLIEEASDENGHYHEYTVASVHDCAGNERNISCRVTLDNGKEVVIGSMTAVGYSVEKYCYIKQDSESPKGAEWCYTTLKHNGHWSPDDSSHDAAWERFRKENL